MFFRNDNSRPKPADTSGDTVRLPALRLATAAEHPEVRQHRNKQPFHSRFAPVPKPRHGGDAL